MDHKSTAAGWIPVERADELTDLTAVTSDPSQGAVALALLEFLRSAISTRLGTESVEVVRFEYMGAYPALAIRAEGADVSVEQVQREIDRTLAETPMSVFLGFLRGHPADWSSRVAELLRRTK